MVGAFLRVSLFRPPLLVIGRSRGASTPNQGVCKVLNGVNEYTNNVTCTSAQNIVDQILNIEAEIGKSEYLHDNEVKMYF